MLFSFQEYYNGALELSPKVRNLQVEVSRSGILITLNKDEPRYISLECNGSIKIIKTFYEKDNDLNERDYHIVNAQRLRKYLAFCQT